MLARSGHDLYKLVCVTVSVAELCVSREQVRQARHLLIENFYFFYL